MREGFFTKFATMAHGAPPHPPVTLSLHANNSKIPRTYVHTSYIFATLKEGGIPICPGEERKCAYFATM